MSVLLGQLKAFFLTLILGIFSGGLFHYYHLTVRKARIGRYWLYLIDLILWVILLLIVFAFLLLINGAEMRLYVLLALACGIAIYFRYLSRYMTPILSRAAQGSVEFSSGLARAIRSPFLHLFCYWKAQKDKGKTPPPGDSGN